MELAALALFCIAAVGGVPLAVTHLRGGNPRFGVIFAHGIFAALAMAFLVLSMLQVGASSLLWTSILLFFLAAVFGASLMVRHMSGKKLPWRRIAIHALAVVAGFVALSFQILH